MSVYRCHICESYIDSDYDGCEEHPFRESELICEGCFEYFINEEGEIMNLEEFLHSERGDLLTV